MHIWIFVLLVSTVLATLSIWNLFILCLLAWQNIVLSGGSTMFRDFGRRLQRDIKRAVDARLKLSEQLSGGRIKVNNLFLQLKAFLNLPWNYSVTSKYTCLLCSSLTFGEVTKDFPAKCRLENKRRNSILIKCHYPDLGRSGCVWLVKANFSLGATN